MYELFNMVVNLLIIQAARMAIHLLMMSPKLLTSCLMLQYKNVRPDYLKNIWKVMNWKYASEVYGKECP